MLDCLKSICLIMLYSAAAFCGLAICGYGFHLVTVWDTYGLNSLRAWSLVWGLIVILGITSLVGEVVFTVFLCCCSAKRKSAFDICGESLPALDRLDSQCERQRVPLRDMDRLGNDLQWVPGFLSCCSWMFPEQLQNKSELLGSEEIHQVYTKHPKCVTPSG